ncbi:hypothetical protein ACOMHN_064369 [Nucella lapillus]
MIEYRMKRTVAIWLYIILSGGVSWGDPGKWFLVTFPQAYHNATLGSCLKVKAVSGQGQVSVSLSTHPSAPSPLKLSLLLQPGQTESYCVDSLDKLLPEGTHISNVTIEVLASADIVVEVLNTVKSNGDIFSAAPVTKLGTDYFAAAGTKRYQLTASFLTVSAPHDNTEVSVTFPPGQRETAYDGGAMDERFVLQGVTYFPNDVITFNLKRLQTMQLQSPRDLTGAHISSSRPVLVLSGQNRTSLSGKGCYSHILEQMPPTPHWAFTFILIHLPEQTAGDHYRFVAKKALTTVTLAGGALILRIQDAGGFAEYDLKDEELVLAVSDKPVMVIQYTREQPASSKSHGDPAMLVLSAWEHALDEYHIVTDPASKGMYAVISVSAADTGLVKLNGQLLSSARNVTWRAVNGSSSHVVGHVSLKQSEVPCTIGESGGPKMNVHVFFVTKCECWAMALTHGHYVSQTSALGSHAPCPVSSHSPGDGTDNDCDHAIDEEPCYVNSEPLDTDGDQYKNEDCTMQEVEKWSRFTAQSNTRRLADNVKPVPEVSKVACAVTCASTAGCWGLNFDPEGREGHWCELLSGWGRGMIAAKDWMFHSVRSHTTFSGP